MSILQPGGRPVVITGGAGFLGANIADRLLAGGVPVVVLDNLARAGVERNLEWLEARHGERITGLVDDIREPEAVEDVVRGCRAVLHLAAQVAVTTSLEDPVADFEINARGTLNVLEALRWQDDPPPLLYASTNKVYGKLMGPGELVRQRTRWEPRDEALARGCGEATPLDFYSPYGCSKGVADQYVLDYARVFGLTTLVFRMSCLYGPRQFGTEDQGWIAHFLIRALEGEPVTIYGDGRQVRDALFVEDAVDAWLLGLEHAHKLRGRAFNLGGGPGNTLSLIELVERIEPLAGRPLAASFAQARPGDQLWYVSAVDAFSAATGWAPRTGLEEGLRRLTEWLKASVVAEPAPAALPA